MKRKFLAPTSLREQGQSASTSPPSVHLRTTTRGQISHQLLPGGRRYERTHELLDLAEIRVQKHIREPIPCAKGQVLILPFLPCSSSRIAVPALVVTVPNVINSDPH